MSLLFLTILIWEWCYTHHMFLVAVHISTEDNYIADQLSRHYYANHEWILDMTLFHNLSQKWGTPILDAFATPLNTKCKLFCSRAVVGRGSLGDAFMVPWSQGLTYLFPPLPLIQRTILKTKQDRTNAIIIAPWWPRQLWFMTLLRMLSTHWRFPFFPDLLIHNNRQVLHPDISSLHLTAWRVIPN